MIPAQDPWRVGMQWERTWSFKDTSQSFLKSVTVKQWSFRFSKVWSLVAFFKVSGYLYHKLLGEELSFFFCFRVTGWPVDRLGWLDGQVTMWNHRRSVSWSGATVGLLRQFCWSKNWGFASLRCKCAQAFYGSKPATVEPFAGRVVFLSFFPMFFLLAIPLKKCFDQEDKRGLLMGKLFWKGNIPCCCKSSHCYRQRATCPCHVLSKSTCQFLGSTHLMRRSMRCAKHCRIPSASFRDLQASMWCECDVVYSINL